MSFPKNYKRAVYIESTGTQYIDTGFKPNQDTRVIIDIEAFKASNTYFVPFGCRVADKNVDYSVWYNLNDATWLATNYGNNTVSLKVTNSFKRLLIDKNKNVTTAGGVTAQNPANSFSSAFNLFLLSLNENGTENSIRRISAKLYACQIYDNDVLVRDYVPCMTDTGEYGLYDLVNDQFYGNAGTGVFHGVVYAELPEGYTQAEYIQSTGTQYIDTGIQLDTTSYNKIKLSVKMLPAFASGAWEVNGTGSWYIGQHDGTVYYGPGVGDVSTGQAAPTYAATYSVDAKNGVVELDGKQLVTYTPKAPSFTANLLIAAYFSGNGYPVLWSGKFYGAQIWNDDALVRDYVPCVSPAGAFGLFDLVTQQFCGNAGTGAFNGLRIAVPVKLPKGYSQVEYIESSGTQYIDTGFMPNNNTRVICDTVFGVQASKWLFGARNGNLDRTFNFIAISSGYRSDFNTRASGEEITTIPSGRFIVDKNSNVTSFDGVVVRTATAGTFQCTHNLFLFANNNNGTVAGHGIAKLYSCQIYDNGTLVRDYIPCATSAGVAGLYDLVTQSFHGNAGTGTFAHGAVIEPIEAPVPSTPTEFVAATDKATVYLSWSEAENATGYYLYRDGVLRATVEGTEYTDTLPGSGSYVYELIAFNEDNEAEAVSTTVTVDLCPPCPSNVCQKNLDFYSVTLEWDEVECNAYKVSRDGEVLATTKATTYTDTGLECGGEYEYAVVAVNEYGESTPAVFAARTIEARFPELVYDRTYDDVLRWLELRNKGYAKMTEAERAEWDAANMKGAYNTSDLNRVGLALNYVRDRLATASYVAPDVFYAKMDWEETDIPTRAEFTAYLRYVAIIRDAMAQYRTTPKTPKDVGGLDYTEANAIEKILVDVDELITKMLEARYYCGELFSGEI